MTMYVMASRVYLRNVEYPPSSISPHPTLTGARMALTWIRPESVAAETWRLGASCRSTDPDLFFPVGTTGLAIDHIASAKAVCAACAVQAPCLEFAIETNQDSGVWGGTSEDERRQIRRRRMRDRRAAAAAAAAAAATG